MSSERSSSASSFSALNDVESVFDGSIIDRSSNQNSVAGVAELDEMEKLKMSNALLKLENMDLREQKVLADLKLFKTQLSGEWKLQSSKNVKEFLENRKGNLLDDIVFQTASKHFEFNGNTLTTFDKAGINILNTKKIELSDCEFVWDRAHVSFVSNNRLKTIELGRDGVESSREEVFISEGGRLHVILKAFGVECTRVYRKIDDHSISGDNGKLRNLQNELKELKEKYVTDVAKLEDSIRMEKESSEQLTTKNAILKQPFGHLSELFNGYWDSTSGNCDIMVRVEGDRFICHHLNHKDKPTIYTFGVEQDCGNNVYKVAKVDGYKIIVQFLRGSGGPLLNERRYEVEYRILTVHDFIGGKYAIKESLKKCLEPSKFPPKYIEFLANIVNM